MILKFKNNKGYTLVFAVLVSAVVITVGVSILNISRKELILSGSARESTYAIHSAESGLECAVFNDNEGKFPIDSGNWSVKCVGQDLVIVPVAVTNGRSGTFHLRLPDNTPSIDGQPCVIVTVRKEYVPDGAGGQYLLTTISSRGYNLGWNNAVQQCNLKHPTRVERALVYTR